MRSWVRSSRRTSTPAEAARRVPGVVQVVERDLVEKAIGAQHRDRAEVADAAALAADLDRALAGAEAAARDRHRAGECASGPEAAAAVQHGHARDLAAELRRNVADHQLRRLHDPDVERVGERAGELIADRQAVDDERHLIVRAARMNGAVGVLREAGKGHQHRFQAAAGDGHGHALDARDGDRVARPRRGTVDDGGLGHHLNRVGHRRQVELDVQLDACTGRRMDAPLRDGEPRQGKRQVVHAHWQVGDFVSAGHVGGRLPLEAARALP